MMSLVSTSALAACLAGTPVAPVVQHGGRPVLFIGNSLTYTNDLPGIVQSLADSAGGDSLDVRIWSEPNFALIDHWAVGQAQLIIASRPWDFVVLQQGPTSVEINRDTLRLATKLFAPSITKAGAKAVLFSAWPTIDRRQDFARAIESARLAAGDVGGLMAPVAAAWLTILTDNPTIQLYDPDGLHPSVTGSYLSALVIYSTITGRSPVGLPASLRVRKSWQFAVDPAVAKLLQDAAWRSVSTPP